ncbi:hypothetical protein D3C86_2077800 [compost metagenome]
MALQQRGGALGGNRSFQRILNRFGLLFTTHQQDDLPCFEDASDAHCHCLAGHIVQLVEEAGIGFPGFFQQVDHMSTAA